MSKDLLGTGFKFPIEFDNGKLATSSSVNSVKSAVFYLLSTRIGERFFRPDFGSLLYTLIFEIADETTIHLAEVYAEDSIKSWIPRIKRVSIKGYISDEQENRIDLYIECVTIDNPVPEAFIYPFYVKGAML